LQGPWPRAGAARVASSALAALSLAGLALTGCGGGSQATAGEPHASFDVKVSGASFPAQQSVAKPEHLQLTVQNAGSHTIPNVAVSVDSLTYASDYPHLAARQRPIWVVEQGPGTAAGKPVETQEVSTPGGGETAYVNTWSLGALAPNSTRTFDWRVVPVKSGTYTIHYTVAAGLGGRARAQLASGGPAAGAFTVKVAGAPALTHVEPKTGKVVPGAYPPTP
jgi:hypothetical protein